MTIKELFFLWMNDQAQKEINFRDYYNQKHIRIYSFLRFPFSFSCSSFLSLFFSLSLLPILPSLPLSFLPSFFSIYYMTWYWFRNYDNRTVWHPTFQCYLILGGNSLFIHLLSVKNTMATDSEYSSSITAFIKDNW